MRSLRWPLLGAIPYLLLLAAPATAQDAATEQYARVQRGQWKESNRWLQTQDRLLPADASLEQRRRKKELELDWQFTVGLFDQVPTRARTPEMTSHPWTRLAWAIAGWNSAHPAEVRDNAEALAALRKADPQSIELQLIEPQARALKLVVNGLPDSAVAVLREATRSRPRSQRYRALAPRPRGAGGNPAGRGTRARSAGRLRARAGPHPARAARGSRRAPAGDTVARTVPWRSCGRSSNAATS
jgi:hypothetical protein